MEVTGEILHGKTSPLCHDAKGLYLGIIQNVSVTRYHSLAGTHSSLPDCLEITSWIGSGPDGGKGIIMGVRHRDLVVEGVQFHPESILTIEGRLMLRNFLKMRGGTWKENEKFRGQSNGQTHTNSHNNVASDMSNGDSNLPKPMARCEESILDRIYKHRVQAVAAQKIIPSQRTADFQASYDLGFAPPQISFPDRLRVSPFSLSLMAEIKRASPSKGVISLGTCAPAQARKYALAGASVISVLTEPEWFKGSIEDLRSVRQSLEGMPVRPAVLRKDFIFDEYQILEARLAGADTVLLIVKMLDEIVLKKLFKYSQSLGMEPLVEVNTFGEMDLALKLGAQVIGVNNRNLTNFEVDLDTTNRLMEKVPSDTIVCALSGISGPSDVVSYRKYGVGAVLVGEALMRTTDTSAFVEMLLGDPQILHTVKHNSPVLVKICGTRTSEAARTAIEAGADLIGVILVEGRRRSIPQDIALEISKVVHEVPKPAKYQHFVPDSSYTKAVDFFAHSSKRLFNPDRALLVGVFQNQPLSHILAQQKLLQLDIIQLHGSEPLEWASQIPVPVIHRFGPNDPRLGRRGYHVLPLLDSAVGGTGQMVEIAAIQGQLQRDDGLRIILAGGLNSDNVQERVSRFASQASQILVVDVSSGVENDGVQSLEKIKAFVLAAKEIRKDH